MHSIHLQGIGQFNAIHAGTLLPGMRIVYNYGASETVLSVADKGEKSVSVVTRSDKSGNTNSARTFRKTRLVAVTRSSCQTQEAQSVIST